MNCPAADLSGPPAWQISLPRGRGPKTPFFWDAGIRARCGLRLTVFPDREGINPEHAGINPARSRISRRNEEVTYRHILWAYRTIDRVSGSGRGPGRGRYSRSDERRDPSFEESLGFSRRTSFIEELRSSHLTSLMTCSILLPWDWRGRRPRQAEGRRKPTFRSIDPRHSPAPGGLTCRTSENTLHQGMHQSGSAEGSDYPLFPVRTPKLREKGAEFAYFSHVLRRRKRCQISRARWADRVPKRGFGHSLVGSWGRRGAVTLQTGIGVLRRRIGGVWGENVMNRRGRDCGAGGGEPEKFFRKDC